MEKKQYDKSFCQKLPKLTEAEFTSQVIELAHLHGWKVAHFRPAQTKLGWRTAVSGDGKGFPDLVLVRAREPRAAVLFIELKIPPNKATPEQEEWIHNLTLCGAMAFCVTPADWPRIEFLLKRPHFE